MKKSKILYPVLIIVLIILFPVISFCHTRNPFKKPPIIMLTEQGATSVDKRDNIKVLLNSLKLSGILNHSIAVINHGFYRVGDKIKIFKIKEIKDNEVVLSSNGKEYQLILDLSREVKEVKVPEKTLKKEHNK